MLSPTNLLLLYMMCVTAAASQGIAPRATSSHEEPSIFENIVSFFSNALSINNLEVTEGARMQNAVSVNQTFPCLINNTNNSNDSLPTSVHQLRPHDISVVAALGDSLIAGTGALAESVTELFQHHKGVSWSIGGDNDWRTVLTIPNILRNFNPRLVGYSSSTKQNDFDMGVPQAHDDDLLHQAKKLVAAMKADPDIDIKRDWKLVTVMSGHNDICSGDPCFPSPEKAERDHFINLQRTLDYLQQNLPRTFVSLLPILDVSEGWKLEKTLVCGMLTSIECQCLYGWGGEDNYKNMKQIVQAYHKAEKQLVESGQYDTKEDFTVELQEFSAKITPPRARNSFGIELADLSFFSVDCFHLSQKGHASFATMQWNNLLEPVGNKSHEFLFPFEKMLCPSEKSPYLFTRRNSLKYFTSGHQ